MFGKKKALMPFNGNWEERGVIGTRIEIDNGRILILWRNSPVLDSKFKAEKKEDGFLHMVLANTGLRYERSNKDYAAVVDIYLENDRLHLIEDFPISGRSETVMTKTEYSRYGNYTIVDDKVLPQLAGSWTDDGGFHTLVFKGGKLTIDDEPLSIHVLRSNSESENSENYKIVNADPSIYEVGHFFYMKYSYGVLSAAIMVCDAPPHEIIFKKSE